MNLVFGGSIPPTVVLVEIAQIAEALPIGEEKCGCESYSRHFDVLAQQVEQLANTQQYIGSKPLNVIAYFEKQFSFGSYPLKMLIRFQYM